MKVETKRNGAQGLAGLFDNRMAITVDELAAALGVTANTVKLWVHRKKIPSRKIGKRRLFIPQEIQTWLLKTRSH